MEPDADAHSGIKAVRHEFTLSIRRNERDGPVILEARETHTLMKFHVL